MRWREGFFIRPEQSDSDDSSPPGPHRERRNSTGIRICRVWAGSSLQFLPSLSFAPRQEPSERCHSKHPNRSAHWTAMKKTKSSLPVENAARTRTSRSLSGPDVRGHTHSLPCARPEPSHCRASYESYCSTTTRSSGAQISSSRDHAGITDSGETTRATR